MSKRKDQYRVTVTLDGVSLGVWDKQSGGDLDSEETLYRPGGMAEPMSLGGSRTVQAVTVSKLYDHDHYAKLLPRAGRGAVVVSRQPLDVDGNAFGAPVVWRGTLKTVKAPEVDSESSEAAMLEIDVTCETSTVPQ